jgi:hypothetical protein
LLFAANLPFPVELSALAMVGLILRWMMQRDATNDSAILVRLERLEASEAEQRHLKHALLNRLAGLKGTLLVILHAARHCTCDALTPVLPLLEELVAEDP